MRLAAGDRVVAELIEAPAALGYTDDRHVERSALDQPHQRGERLQLREVSGCPENHQCVHFVAAHGLIPSGPACADMRSDMI